MVRKTLQVLITFVMPLLLIGCDSVPNQPQRYVSPLEACVNEARRDAAFCEMGALGTVKSGFPASYYECGNRKIQQEDRCQARFNPSYVPTTPKNQPQQQQRAPQQQRNQFTPTLVKQWTGRNAERFCQYSDGSVKNVGYDLCD